MGAVRMTNILVVGGGAREHALIWKLAQSPSRPLLFAAPGNPGVAALARCLPIGAEDVSGIVTAARDHAIDLVVIGPEAPLIAGLADQLRAAGIAVFGPSAAAAQLEGSKSFAKELMARAGIPTARYATFEDAAAARAYIERHGAPVVVKADGLAAGKGVMVARTVPEALAVIEDVMERGIFGQAGHRVVLEDYLEGDELSVMALVAGESFHLLPPAQDHKQVYDGDQGPNTGGMGTFAPVPWAGETLLAAVRERVFAPLLRALGHAGLDYRGVIYAGLMITRDGPRVIEFNARFGDPETQVTLPLLEGDFAATCAAVAQGTLNSVAVRVAPGAAVGVVLASGGYPGAYTTGYPIAGLDALPPGALAFHAGTRATDDGTLVTAGGRVLTLVGLGDDLAGARERAYAAVARVSFAGAHYRHDIGLRERRVTEASAENAESTRRDRDTIG
jgi:phosphoribosylamine--glycine ligase